MTSPRHSILIQEEENKLDRYGPGDASRRGARRADGHHFIDEIDKIAGASPAMADVSRGGVRVTYCRSSKHHGKHPHGMIRTIMSLHRRGPPSHTKPSI